MDNCQDFLLSKDELSPICTTNSIISKFSSKVILTLSFTALSNINVSANNNEFILDESSYTKEYIECPVYESYMNSQPNRDSIESDLLEIEFHPDNWWNEYNADRPNDLTFDNVRRFLNSNKNDKLLEGAEVLPKRNATILFEWEGHSFMCSLNIGEHDFSYSILPFDDTEPLTGMFPIENMEEIDIFYQRLESFVNA